MKAAIPTWNGRVSPVFDVTRNLLVVDVENNTEVSRSEAVLEEMPFVGRTKQLADQDVDVLICGAISQSMEQTLVSMGVTVIPNTCGLVEEVLRAFLSGQLTEHGFLMPGCERRRGWRGRQRRGGGSTKRETAIGCDRRDSQCRIAGQRLVNGAGRGRGRGQRRGGKR